MSVLNALEHTAIYFADSPVKPRAYVKHAEVTVPSLADWEKDWQENLQRGAQPKLLPELFRLPMAQTAQTN